ncbi:hypothetical protein Tco_0690230 [Tanacetum coccineum]
MTPHQTLYEYYWRFSQLINDMHTIEMTMQQVQVNTKFLNTIPSEWSKFVTNVKLAKSLYTTNYDQLYAYLSQHERHANEVRITRERYPDPLALVADSPTLYNPSQSPQHSAEFPQLDSNLAVPMFQQGEDLIECINKAMAFLSAVASSSTTSKGNFTAGQSRVVKCYNCQGEGHMTEDLDAYNSDCDDISSAKAVLMANLLSCDPEVLSEVPYYDSYPNDMINQDVQEMQYSEQTHIDGF